MFSTTQILQLILLAAAFAAAVFILAGPKSTKRPAPSPLFLVSASSLFLVLIITEAVYSIYYVKFILGYGVNAALLSLAAAVILILPFSQYILKMTESAKSVPFNLVLQRSKATVTVQQVPSKKSTTIIKDQPTEKISSEKTEPIISAEIQSPEPIISVDENANNIHTAEEKTDILNEADNSVQSEAENEIIPVVEAGEKIVPDELSKASENQPENSKPVQRTTKTKRRTAKSTQPKNTAAKSKGRKKK